ncbi:uncharacterized protein LOC114538132 [Dendronephthya gigantea]|uniref:uncharacterized protein LOC114538132 n=1 Tax=Dendronephthya gigantea TaxID=151771 RepID=UPI00106C781B|nr:uncharacterized protein LOC114538132 [Dendronephthya gigantea]
MAASTSGGCSMRVPLDRKYLETLTNDSRKKYQEKLNLINNIDPYNVSSNFFTESMEMWPNIEYPDIVTYFLCSTSRYTKEQIKAYKSLESYQYFIAGWVNHSQRLNETPLKTWVAAEDDGNIITAHCNCVAGFGDTCSHVGALLFAVEAEPLTQLYSAEFNSMGYQELLAKSIDIFQKMNISFQQAKLIEEVTKSQSKSSLWFQMRAGRITASKFHQACHTDPASPSLSLVKEVCYGLSFTSKATTWGCTHENEAVGQYKQIMEQQHKDFTLKESGFVINIDFPHLGASPDRISCCSCHGAGCVEVKCPYCLKKSSLTTAVENGEKFCLIKNAANGLKLDKKHPYFYQVQLQLAATKLNFADFVV